MEDAKYKVVVVDDDKDIADYFVYILNEAGFTAEVFYNSEEFLKKYNFSACFRNGIDVVLLDLMLGKTSGQNVLKSIRSHDAEPAIQVVIVSSRNEEITKATLFEAGADDYVEKSIGRIELMARINARINNRYRAVTSSETIAEHGLQLKNNQAYLDGQDLELTALSMKLLKYFIKNSNVYLSRIEIENAVYGYAEHADSKALDVSISRLKKKLTLVNSMYKNCITAKRGIGWIFQGPVSE
ncbi:MAG: response regulator transcription factor [Candidatus Ancillula sp.]|nr:response regulator transcription factor [Candidatus Ancillula sp.]